MLQGPAPQVEVSVPHAEVVAAVRFVLDGKGRHFRSVEHLQGGHFDLDIAGSAIGVLAGPLAHLARGGDDELAAKLAGLLAEFGAIVHVEDQLSDPVAVAQIDEGHAAEVATFLDPTAQFNFQSDVFDAEFSAGVRAIHV